MLATRIVIAPGMLVIVISAGESPANPATSPMLAQRLFAMNAEVEGHNSENSLVERTLGGACSRGVFR